MQRDADGTVMEGSDGDSSDDEDECMDDVQPIPRESAPKQGPIVDDDGFQLVQPKRGGRQK